MKKIIGSILAVCALLILFAACDDSKSYADRLKDERKMIKNFIVENNIELLDKFPEDTVFKDNQFFFDSTSGIYINIVDTGNGTRAKGAANESRSKVSVRFKNVLFLPSKEPSTNLGPNGSPSLDFLYGLDPTYYVQSSASADEYLFLSPGIVAPLKYVGEEGIVKLIIPFNQGSYYQQYDIYSPAYVGYLRYIRID